MKYGIASGKICRCGLWFTGRFSQCADCEYKEEMQKEANYCCRCGVIELTSQDTAFCPACFNDIEKWILSED